MFMGVRLWQGGDKVSNTDLLWCLLAVDCQTNNIIRVVMF